MVTFMFHVLTYFRGPRTGNLEKVKKSNAASHHFFSGWLQHCSCRFCALSRSLAALVQTRVKRGMSARASGMVVLNLEPVTADIGKQEEHFILDAHISLSLPPISLRTGETNGRQAQSLIVAGHRSTYRSLLALVFNAQPAWVHLANHNSSVSP